MATGESKLILHEVECCFIKYIRRTRIAAAAAVAQSNILIAAGTKVQVAPLVISAIYQCT